MSDYFDSPIKVIYGLLICILIIFPSNISVEYRAYADTFFGRLVGIGATVLTIKYLGWMYALLVVLAYLVVLHGAPRLVEEGFNGQIIKQAVGHRWYVERVLGENPEAIETEKVTTNAVQDLSRRGMNSQR